jgi:hypothetical protein
MSVSMPPFSLRRRTRKARQSGTNLGYDSTSATSSNISAAPWQTRRLVWNDGMPAHSMDLEETSDLL